VARIDFLHVNPVSGSVHIKGARPGDVLAVEALELRPSNWGWTALMPGFDPLADEFPEPWLWIWKIEPAAGAVLSADGISVALRRFPDTIGVAPVEPGEHSILPPSRWGGNLETSHLVAGSTVTCRSGSSRTDAPCSPTRTPQPGSLSWNATASRRRS
jgi:acetamidase/formamidase